MIVNNSDIRTAIEAIINQLNTDLLTTDNNFYYFFGTGHESNLPKKFDLPYMLLEGGFNQPEKFTTGIKNGNIPVTFRIVKTYKPGKLIADLEDIVTEMRVIADALIDLLIYNETIIEDSEYSKDSIYNYTDNNFCGIALKCNLHYQIGSTCG